MAKKIYLSPSNQNGNLYKGQNTNEMEQCNRIAAAAEKHLERNGFEVKRAKKGQDMWDSIKESNKWGSDLHIPIHTNAGGGEGTVVFVYSKDANNMKYATPIYNSVQAVSPGKTDYGVREYADLAELNATSAIAVYVECEFHDNATLAKWIVNHVDDLGAAIAKGVCKAEGKKYIKEKPAAAPAKKDTIYRVQVGAFREKKNAEAMEKKLKKDGYSTIVKEEKK
jgi:N-acetylmuramoyl-L-alanine amidase